MTPDSDRDSLFSSGVGKTVRIRRYPVTVSVESFDRLLKATGIRPGKVSQISLKRKSGDLPEANQADSASLGELKSILADFDRKSARALPKFIPAQLGCFNGRLGKELNDAGDAPGFRDSRSWWCS